MLLRAYRAAELHVNMLKDNIEIDMKEVALVIKWTENYLSTRIHNIAIVSHNIWQKMNIFSW